jgi:hypothetical protein
MRKQISHVQNLDLNKFKIVLIVIITVIMALLKSAILERTNGIGVDETRWWYGAYMIKVHYLYMYDVSISQTFLRPMKELLHMVMCFVEF